MAMQISMSADGRYTYARLSFTGPSLDRCLVKGRWMRDSLDIEYMPRQQQDATQGRATRTQSPGLQSLCQSPALPSPSPLPSYPPPLSPASPSSFPASFPSVIRKSGRTARDRRSAFPSRFWHGLNRFTLLQRLYLSRRQEASAFPPWPRTGVPMSRLVQIRLSTSSQLRRRHQQPDSSIFLL